MLLRFVLLPTLPLPPSACSTHSVALWKYTHVRVVTCTVCTNASALPLCTWTPLLEILPLKVSIQWTQTLTSPLYAIWRNSPYFGLGTCSTWFNWSACTITFNLKQKLSLCNPIILFHLIDKLHTTAPLFGRQCWSFNILYIWYILCCGGLWIEQLKAIDVFNNIWCGGELSFLTVGRC